MPAVPALPARILYIRTDRLGETLLTLPALAAVRQAFPGSRLTFLAHPALAGLLRGWPVLDEVVEDRSDGRLAWWRRAGWLAERLRPLRCDAAIVSNPKKELHLAVWLAGIPIRIGYDRKWAWTLNRRLSDDKALGERHEVEYNLELVRLLGVPAASVPPVRLPIAPADAAALLDLLAARGVGASDVVVAAHPWTSNPKKQWPLDRFAEVIRRLQRLPNVVVVLVGGPEEQAGAGPLLGMVAGRAVNLVGRLSLRGLAACLSRARVLVSNDSGPVHVAAAVGTPTVVLFGTIDPAAGPRRWGPWGDGHTVLCRPTVEQTTAEEVTAAVERYVGG